MSDLKKEFEFYLNHKEELLKQHLGKFIAIKNGEILGVYTNRVQAINETKKSHELGSFLVQEVTPLAEEVRFHSRYAI